MLRARLTVLVLLGSALVAPAAATAPAARAVKCQGERPTLEVTGPEVRGTSGDDVILISGNPRSIKTFGGDDRICVRLDDLRRTLSINAGPGDDRILVTGAAGGTVRASLGPGADRYRGYDGRDLVTDAEGTPAADRIATGAGKDEVTLRTGATGAAAADVVRTGAGDDLVSVLGFADSSGALIDAGTEADELALRLPAAGADSGSLDLQVPELRLGDTVVADGWRGVERLDLTTGVPLAVTGSDADDDVHADLVSSAAMGEGDDVIDADALAADAVLDGGAGEGDVAVVRAAEIPAVGDGDPIVAALRVDLASGGQSLDTVGDVVSAFTLLGLEGLVAWGASDVEVTGTEADDELTVNACAAVVQGLGGADVVRDGGDQLGACDAADRALEFRGGAGADRLTGGVGRDDLQGGPDRDLADGRQNSDRCVAEVERLCER